MDTSFSAIRQVEVELVLFSRAKIRTEFADERGGVIPHAAVESERVVTQLVQHVLDLAGRQNVLDHQTRADRS